MTAQESAEDFIRHFLDTYESHDLDAFWTLYSPDWGFPVLERFGIDPTWKNYKTFMTRFIDAFPDVHHTIEKIVADGDNIWALYTVTARILAHYVVWNPQASKCTTPLCPCIESLVA